MQWSSVFKAVGLVIIIALGVAAVAYQKEEDPNLIYLFGLYLLTGILGAFFFFKVIIPALGESITTAMVESGEEPEEPPMVRIRALVAQGEYATAAQEIKHVIAENPGDKIPWLERAKLHQERLADPGGAITTYKEALKAFEWEDEDAAFFYFRLVDLHVAQEDNDAAIEVLDQIVERFPDSRYAANARHKKQELASGDVPPVDPVTPATPPRPASPPHPGKPTPPPPV